MAARFAAKEAFAKALGSGFNSSVHMNEIEILNDCNGKPFVNALGQTKETFLSLGFVKAEVSLSHEEDFAIAMVILEK